MSARLPFATYFEPAVKPRENVRLYPSKKFYTVIYIEPLQPIIINLGSVASDKETSLHECTELDLKQLELGQWRFLPLADVEITLKQPRATERGTTKTSSTKISPYSIVLDPHLRSTEVWTFEDENRVYISAKNISQYTINPVRVLFFGWKYLLDELKETPAKWTDIFVATLVRATK